MDFLKFLNPQTMETEIAEEGKTPAFHDIMEQVGLKEFKAYIRELDRMKPYLQKWNHKQAYPTEHILLAMNSGDGITTVIKLFYEYLMENRLFYCFCEEAELYFQEMILEDVEKVNTNISMENKMKQLLDQLDEKLPGVAGIHIEDWLNKTDNLHFENLLKFCVQNRHQCTFIFIVPYVEEEVLQRIYRKLNDRLNIRLIHCPPYQDAELLAAARTVMKKKYNIILDEDANRGFCHALAIERSDQRFYGMKTMMKLVTELVLQKYCNFALKRTNSPEKRFTAEDYKGFLPDDFYMSHISAFDRLDDMIGLDEVKQRLREITLSMKLEREMGEKPSCCHMMFIGNPGTGKTEIARLLGCILYETGVLPVGDLFEVSRFDLVGEFIGQTAPKTVNACRQALGSVLFIDEAYLLALGHDRDDSGKDFGTEALGALIAEMENNRDNLIVILAGYEKEMDQLLEMNPGLRDRVPHKLYFSNYSREELFLIFMKKIRDHFTYEKDFEAAAKSFFMGLSTEQITSSHFGNGRFVRNMVERVRIKAFIRQSQEENRNRKQMVLKPIDFESAVSDADISGLNHKEKRRKIGFSVDGGDVI